MRTKYRTQNSERRTAGKRMIAWDRLEVGELTYAQSIGMLGRDSTKYKPCSEVATVTHVRSDSTILQSWSLSYEVEQGYVYAKSVGQQNRTTLLCLFLCRHLSPNAETRALVEEVLVTLEKVTTTSRALLDVASVTHIRSDSRILKS